MNTQIKLRSYYNTERDKDEDSDTETRTEIETEIKIYIRAEKSIEIETKVERVIETKMGTGIRKRRNEYRDKSYNTIAQHKEIVSFAGWTENMIVL